MENKENLIPLDDSDIGIYLRANVLTVPEVAKMLNLTKQRIYALIKTEQLKPAKTGTLTLFARSEIDRFIKGRQQKAEPHKIKQTYPVLFESVTDPLSTKSTIFWEKHKAKIDCIEEIRIYGTPQDAAVDGYYKTEEPYFGHLYTYASPTMIVRAKNGVQLWLRNCNCGYDGTGSQETVRILTDAQLSGLLKSDYTKDDWETFIFYEEKCIISQLEDDDSMTCHAATNSILGRNHKFTDWHQIFNSTIQLFPRESGLVLVQSDNPTMTDEIEKAYNLQIHMDFLPNPTSYRYFQTSEEAMKNRYNCLSRTGKMTGYQVIFSDRSGRELWIEAIEEPKRKFTQTETISNILLEIGYELPFDVSTLPEKDIAWLSKQVDRTDSDPGTPVFIN